MRGISWLAENRSASQEGLCYMDSKQTKDGSSLHNSLYVMHSQLQYLNSKVGRQMPEIFALETEKKINDMWRQSER